MASGGDRVQTVYSMGDWKPAVLSSVAVAAVVLAVTGWGGGARVELPLRDALLRARASTPATVVAVVAVDDASISALGRWPWSRERLAALVERAREEGATSVAVDILLLDPAPGDDALGRALAESGGMLVAGFDPAAGPLLPPPALAERAELVHGVLELDGDGVLRRLASTKQTEAASYAAMSAAIAARVDAGYRIPVGREITPLFSVRPDDVPVVRASDLLAGGAQPVLSGRVALVGVSATGLGDRVVTPVTEKGRLDAGVVVHAAAAESIARGDLVRVVPPWIAALAAAALAIAAWGAARLSGTAHVAAVVAVIALPLAAGSAAFFALKLASPMTLLTAASVGMVLLVESRTLLAVARGMGRASRALGEGSEATFSPAERVRRLEELATSIAGERRQALESQREVAHELRTPLTSIQGLAKLLAAYDLTDDERRRVAGMVAEESARLHEMVESLLDLERIALRDRAERGVRVDVSALLGRRAEMARAAGSHPIAPETEDAPFVEGEADLLERMVENLVGNAMKFSPPGTTVILRGFRRGGEVVIEVEDEGPGVAPDERERVFRRFARGRAAEGRAGLGLGLAFVAEIARRHGGRAEVDAGARGGACFRVTLPAMAGGAEERQR
jgi:signal transduction histidine kinase